MCSPIEHEAMNPVMVQVLTSVSYSALALQIYDWLYNIAFEFSCIWAKSFCLQKWQYLFSQYAAIGAQIANIIVMGKLFAPAAPLTDKTYCQAWYFFVVGVGELLLVSLELTIIHRIYALFNQNKALLAVLLALVASELSVVLIVPLCGVLRTEFFGAACLMNNQTVPLTSIVVPIAQVMNQIILFSLLISKRGMKSIPIISLVVRDGAWMFVALFALLASIVIEITLTNLEYVSPHMCHALFPIYVGVISITTCHLIRNVEGISKDTSSESCDQESAFVLTSLVTDSESSHPLP